MTVSLAEKTCTPCRGGVPPLTAEEAQSLRSQAPDWVLQDDAHRIERTFRFRNFRESLAFAQQVGELAEAEAHHPDISFGWGYATVSLRTKKIKGLHENDFIMAAKIDQLMRQPDG
jgi:4a-hydroxytetrahydrobiopterin dehydratase